MYAALTQRTLAGADCCSVCIYNLISCTTLTTFAYLLHLLALRHLFCTRISTAVRAARHLNRTLIFRAFRSFVDAAPRSTHTHITHATYTRTAFLSFVWLLHRYDLSCKTLRRLLRAHFAVARVTRASRTRWVTGFTPGCCGIPPHTAFPRPSLSFPTTLDNTWHCFFSLATTRFVAPGSAAAPTHLFAGRGSHGGLNFFFGRRAGHTHTLCAATPLPFAHACLRFSIVTACTRAGLLRVDTRTTHTHTAHNIVTRLSRHFVVCAHAAVRFALPTRCRARVFPLFPRTRTLLHTVYPLGFPAYAYAPLVAFAPVAHAHARCEHRHAFTTRAGCGPTPPLSRRCHAGRIHCTAARHCAWQFFTCAVCAYVQTRLPARLFCRWLSPHTLCGYTAPGLRYAPPVAPLLRTGSLPSGCTHIIATVAASQLHTPASLVIACRLLHTSTGSWRTSLQVLRTLLVNSFTTGTHRASCYLRCRFTPHSCNTALCALNAPLLLPDALSHFLPL